MFLHIFGQDLILEIMANVYFLKFKCGSAKLLKVYVFFFFMTTIALEAQGVLKIFYSIMADDFLVTVNKLLNY